MSTLHIIAADGAAMMHCLHAAAPGDTVVLIGNGVYCLAATGFARRQARAKGVAWCALSEDVAQRGIGDRVPATVRAIDDGDFVDLVATHQPIVSWAS